MILRRSSFIFAILLLFSVVTNRLRAQVNPGTQLSLAPKTPSSLLDQKNLAALTNLNQIIAAKPAIAENYYLRAGILGSNQDFTAEVADCTTAIGLDPNTAKYYARRGHGEWHLKDSDAALADCNQALSLDSNITLAYEIRSAVFLLKGDKQSAMDDVNEVLFHEPQNADFLMNRAILYFSTDNPPAAIPDLTKVIHQNAHLDEACKLRGMLYMAMSNYPAAIADYTLAIEQEPTNAQVYYLRFEARHDAGDFKDALEDAKASLKLDAHNPTNCTQVALVLATCPDHSLRDYPLAIDLAKKACELSEWKDSYCIFVLAFSHALSGHRDESIKYQKQCLATPGLAESERPEMEKTLQVFEKATADHPVETLHDISPKPN